GVGVNSWRVCRDAVEAADFDCVLLAGRYTLLEQEALAFLSLCERRGVGVIVGAPYNSGILARGAAPGARHDYAAPAPQIAERVRRIDAVCARHRTSLGAAALQPPPPTPPWPQWFPAPRARPTAPAGGPGPAERIAAASGQGRK